MHYLVRRYLQVHLMQDSLAPPHHEVMPWPARTGAGGAAPRPAGCCHPQRSAGAAGAAGAAAGGAHTGAGAGRQRQPRQPAAPPRWAPAPCCPAAARRPAGPAPDAGGGSGWGGRKRGVGAGANCQLLKTTPDWPMTFVHPCWGVAAKPKPKP
jgi:hypothetical protein